MNTGFDRGCSPVVFGVLSMSGASTARAFAVARIEPPRGLAVVDGLVSVTQRAWGLELGLPAEERSELTTSS